MTIDLRACERCSEELKQYCAQTELLYDGIRQIYTELSGTEAENIELLAFELRTRMQQLEEQLYQLRSLICALDVITLVWESTEKKVASTSYMPMFKKPVLPPCYVRYIDNVPNELSEIFR